MNFLAHAWLAGPEPADRLGGVVGDFVKGPLPAGLPAELAAGVALHRRIDSYAETHPAFKRSRARVSPARRRVAGIMVDMFYDHFLARHWSRYSPEPLEAFAAGLYRLMAENRSLLPERFAGIFPAMAAEDWLTSYRDADTVGLVLDRMARHRLSRPNTLQGGGEELLAEYGGFEADFEDFCADALAFAEAFRRARQGF